MIKKVWSARLKRETWSFDITINKVRYRDNGFDTKGDAEAAVGALRIRIKKEKYGLPTETARITLRELVAAREQDLNPEKKTHRRARTVIRAFCGHFPPGTAVHSLTAADMKSFAQRRMKESNLRPNSLNRELIDISSMLHAAGIYFPSLENWKPPAIPWAKTSERGRERVLSAEERELLLAALRRDRDPKEPTKSVQARYWVADVLQTALMTGMRLGEILHLRWERVDLREQTIIAISKTDAVRTIPMTPTVRRIVEARRQLSTNDYVFGNGTDKRTLIYRVLRRACAVAGIKYGQRVAGGFTFHDSRHTATTALLHAGTDLATVQSITGHSMDVMTLRYGHATLKSRQRAIAALEEAHAPSD